MTINCYRFSTLIFAACLVAYIFNWWSYVSVRYHFPLTIYIHASLAYFCFFQLPWAVLCDLQWSNLINIIMLVWIFINQTWYCWFCFEMFLSLVQSENAMPEEEVLFPFPRLCWFDYLEGTICALSSPDISLALTMCMSSYSSVIFHFSFSDYQLLRLFLSHAGAIPWPTTLTNKVWKCRWWGEISFLF